VDPQAVERRAAAAQRREEQAVVTAQRKAERAAEELGQATALLAAAGGKGAAFVAYQNLEKTAKRFYPTETQRKIDEALTSIKFDRARIDSPRLGAIVGLKGRRIDVFRDWIICGRDVYDVDASTRGQVYVDGSVQVTSAVVPKGNKGKTRIVETEHDLRTARVQLASTVWSVSMPIALSRTDEARRLVYQLLAHVETLKPRAGTGSISTLLDAILRNTGQPAAERITELSNLRYEHLLSDEEFEKAKAKILGID
jgi:ribosomal protein L24